TRDCDCYVFFFSSRRRHTRWPRDWSSDVCSSDLGNVPGMPVKPGSMGLPLPGVPIVLVDPLTGRPADEGEICVDLARRPMSLMRSEERRVGKECRCRVTA